MPTEYTITTEIAKDEKLAIVAEPVGQVLVATHDIVADLGKISTSIRRVSEHMLAAVRQAGPSKVTLELGFGLAVEAGVVIALLGKGRAESSIRVVLEWSGDKVGVCSAQVQGDVAQGVGGLIGSR